MRIDRLELRAFRGIRGTLQLDLTSPLTLLYAPNGTGKTSICDAVEWLLTGKVGRMGHNLTKAGSDLRCRFSQEPTRVEAEIRKNSSSSKRLRRELLDMGSKLRHRPTEKEWSNYRNSDALRWCAPLAPRHARKGSIPVDDARRWLRATHFLEGPSLAFLIESSNKAKETRRLLFAQLLGIGEIENRDQLFDRLLERLRPELNRLDRELANLDSVYARRRQVAESTRHPPEDLQRRAREALDVARGAMEPHLPDPPAEIPLLRVALDGEFSSVEKKLDALRHLQANFSNWPSLEERIGNARELIEDIEAERKNGQSELAQLEKALGQVSTDHRRYASRAKSVNSLASQVGELRHEFDRLLSEWEPLFGGTSGELKLGQVKAEVDRLELEREQARERRGRLGLCRKKLPDWQRTYAGERRQAERMEKLRQKLEPDDALNERRIELEGLAKFRDQILREQGELTAALDQLRILLGAADESPKAGMPSGAESARCPLCGHDHDTPDALSKAIWAAVEATPEALKIRSRRIEAVQKDIALQHERLEKQNQLRRRLKKSEEQHVKTVAVLADAVKRLEDALLMTVDESYLGGPGLAAQLESLHEEEKGVLEKLAKDTEIARQQFVARSKLRDASLVLAEVGESLAQFASTDLSSVPRPTPAAWLRQLAQIETMAEQTRQEETERLAVVAGKKEQLAQELEGSKGHLQETNRRLGSLRAELADALKELAALKESWKLLGAPGPSPTKPGLERTKQNLERQDNELKRAKDALEKAVLFGREAEQAAKAHKDVEELRDRLEEHRRERDNLKIWAGDLEKARRRLEIERSRYIRSQIEPLSEVISAVYRRAQGNEVVDRIEPLRQGVDAAELLGWQPRIGDEEFAISQLSLGQRQDLALAIFLARARSLGGSFFLDEPLIHLDDLNRVALLDIFRVLAIDSVSVNGERTAPELRLIVTTASSALMRHFREKFSLVPWCGEVPPLRIYELEGSPQQGVKVKEIKVPEDPGYANWFRQEGAHQ